MNKDIIVRLHQMFEGFAFTQEGLEYWMARDPIVDGNKMVL